MGSGRLKPGWTRVAFGDIAICVNDRIDNPTDAGVQRYVGLEHLDPDSLVIRRWGTPGDVTATKLRFRKGDIIFGRRRVYQRKLAVAEFDGICSAHAMVLRVKSGAALSQFLPFFMQSDVFMERAKLISVGSLSPTINWRTLAREEFALPPLDEQRRVANLLGASSSASNALARLVSSIEHARQATVDCATEGTRGLKVRIEDLCEMQNGRPFPRSEYSGQGLRLLRPGNLGPNGHLMWEPSKTVCLPERWRHDASDFVVRKGDVLINLTAQSLDDRFMGRTCVAGMHDISLLNQRIGRFRNWSDDVLPEYVFRVLQSTRFQRHVTSMCEGSKVKHLFWSHISRFATHVPPIPEQEAAVAVLQSVDDLLNAVGRRAEKQRLLHGVCLSVLNESEQTTSGE